MHLVGTGIVLTLTVSACATVEYPCSLDSSRGWVPTEMPAERVTEIAGRDLSELVPPAEESSVQWFMGDRGSLLACVPGKGSGACARSEFFYANGCGQTTIEFEKTAGGWREHDGMVVFCTCDKRQR